MPRVSVIMNVWNGAGTLGEAIESVLAQTYADWEIVLWDDRSTDASAEIAARYREPRIRYFLSPAKHGLGWAREQAIRQASGEWIAFLDQDDIWLPQKLEKQLALAEADPAGEVGLLYGRTVAFYEQGHQRDYDPLHEYGPLPEGDIFEDLFRSGCFISISSFMLSRAALEIVGAIPEAVTVIPDYYLFVGAARHFRARAVQQVVCRYRLHMGSMSHFSHHRMHEEGLWLVNQWSSCLEPDLVEERRRKHNTVAAWQEMRCWRTATAGVKRLLAHGSLGFLITRPPVRAFRIIRRRLDRPFWTKNGSD